MGSVLLIHRVSIVSEWIDCTELFQTMHDEGLMKNNPQLRTIDLGLIMV